MDSKAKWKEALANGKIYKQNALGRFRMFPSDPMGSLDDFIFNLAGGVC